jgi:hypothetical protein
MNQELMVFLCIRPFAPHHPSHSVAAIVNTNLTLADSQEFNLIRKQGKVRDIYNTNEYVIIVATDRQSAFDRPLAGVPFKVTKVMRSC